MQEDEANEEDEHSSRGFNSDQITPFIDCKETPGSGCDNTERLCQIREGKRVIDFNSDLNSPARERDSHDWYNWCGNDIICRHISDVGHGEGETPTIIVTHVWVARSLLGLSPTGGAGHFLLGEVLSEFEHAITKNTMYKLDFGGVLGVHAIAKENCTHVVEENVPGPSVVVDGGGKEVNVLPTQDSTFTLDLPPYLKDATDNSDEEAINPDWKAEFIDWQGNSNSSNSHWVLSDDGSDPEFVEDSILLQPDIDFESLEFKHCYGLAHWENLSTTLLPDRIPFIGPSPDPVRRQSRRPVPVHEFFAEYWSLPTLTQICEQTNAYAQSPSYRNPVKTNGGLNWEDLSPQKLKCWLGICIMMGLKKLPNTRLYWDRRNFFGCPLVRAAMRRARFEKICRNSHLVDNSTLVTDKADPQYDKIGKVRWLLESFVSTCKRLYNCERHICVDEIMIPYRGRRCTIKQCMKNKPVKYEIKVWCCATSKSRYVYDLEVYTGRKGHKSQKDLGRKVVLALVRDLKGLGHVVVTDRFFTSPRLFDDLLKLGFLATGTVMPNRTEMPLSLISYAHIAGERGGLMEFQCACSTHQLIQFKRAQCALGGSTIMADHNTLVLLL